jgi:hypothetical protein
MLCMLTVRHLKAGTDEAFREAWAPERWHHRMVRAYHLRNEDDPDRVVTLGFFEGSQEDLDAMRDDPAWMAGRSGAFSGSRRWRTTCCSAASGRSWTRSSRAHRP